MDKKELKIGIVTHYYNSLNYGGNFQAYALVKYISNNYASAEQICYEFINDEQENEKKSKAQIIKNRLKRCVRLFARFPVTLYKLICRIRYKKQISEIIQKKKQAFSHFNRELILNGKKEYNSNDISQTLQEYDVFITGSDQVWNTTWYRPVFFLDFVPSTKTKISYAASISLDSLNDSEIKMFKRSLADFKAISVREVDAVNLIKTLAPVQPQVVLDPTMLLERNDWDEVCAERVVGGKYLLCYFLGKNKEERRLAIKFAKKKNLKIVSVPLTGERVYSDLNFGDVILPFASPEEFLSLIKYADYIFTDSFHAVVFSNIYQRQYFVFNRDKKGSMSSRIFNIVNLFNTQERYCNNKNRENIEYILSLNNIEYEKENVEFEKMKETSIKFLKEALSI